MHPPSGALSPLLSSGGFQAGRLVYIPESVNSVAFIKFSMYVCMVQTDFIHNLKMFLVLYNLAFEPQLHHRELLHQV